MKLNLGKNTILTILGSLLSSQLYANVEIDSRSDLGIFQTFNITKVDLETLKEIKKSNLSTQYLHFSTVIPEMHEIAIDENTIEIKGEMKVASGSQEVIRRTTTWVDCDDLNKRYARAEVLKGERSTYEQQFKELLYKNNLDELSVAEQTELLKQATEILDKMLKLWEEIELVAPSSLMDKTYEINYQWPRNFNHICKNDIELSPELGWKTYSMPGIFYNTEQGGGIGEFFNYFADPHYNKQTLVFRKKASARELCRDSHAVRILAETSTILNSDCPGAENSTILFSYGKIGAIGHTVLEEQTEQISCKDLYEDLQQWLNRGDHGVSFVVNEIKLTPKRSLNFTSSTFDLTKATEGHGILEGGGRSNIFFAHDIEGQQQTTDRSGVLSLRFDAEGGLKFNGIDRRVYRNLAQLTCSRNNEGFKIRGDLQTGNKNSRVDILVQKYTKSIADPQIFRPGFIHPIPPLRPIMPVLRRSLESQRSGREADLNFIEKSNRNSEERSEIIDTSEQCLKKLLREVKDIKNNYQHVLISKTHKKTQLMQSEDFANTFYALASTSQINNDLGWWELPLSMVNGDGVSINPILAFDVKALIIGSQQKDRANFFVTECLRNDSHLQLNGYTFTKGSYSYWYLLFYN